MDSHETRRSFLRTSAAATSGIGLTSLAGCTALFDDDGDIAVGSKTFEEHVILGYMAIETIEENTDLSVEDETRLGGTDPNWRALENQEIDLYWEYTGTAYEIILGADEMIFEPDELYEAVRDGFDEEHGHAYLDYSEVNNTYVMVGDPDWTDENGIESLSDFAEHVQENPSETTVVMDAEFRERSDGWQGVAEHYEFDDVIDDIDTQDIETGVTYQVLDEGEADVGMGFNTDPQIDDFGLSVFDDDEQFFPAYNPAPLVNGESFEEYPEIEEPLNDIAPTLTNEKMRELNYGAVIDEESPRDLAREFLDEEGLI